MTKEEDNELRKQIRLISLCATIPFILAVPPVLGWLIGSWLDQYFVTKPYLMYCFIILGCVAGIREFIRILNQYL